MAYDRIAAFADRIAAISDRNGVHALTAEYKELRPRYAALREQLARTILGVPDTPGTPEGPRLLATLDAQGNIRRVLATRRPDGRVSALHRSRDHAIPEGNT